MIPKIYVKLQIRFFLCELWDRFFCLMPTSKNKSLSTCHGREGEYKNTNPDKCFIIFNFSCSYAPTSISFSSSCLYLSRSPVVSHFYATLFPFEFSFSRNMQFVACLVFLVCPRALTGELQKLKTKAHRKHSAPAMRKEQRKKITFTNLYPTDEGKHTVRNRQRK